MLGLEMRDSRPTSGASGLFLSELSMQVEHYYNN